MKGSNYDGTAIKHTRMNGLKLLAAQEGRSIIKQLDWILKHSGVKELTDSALEKELKKINSFTEALLV